MFDWFKYMLISVFVIFAGAAGVAAVWQIRERNYQAMQADRACYDRGLQPAWTEVAHPGGKSDTRVTYYFCRDPQTGQVYTVQ